eukprot:8038234-Lingulodinium_polyedra.AAC.1
MRLLGRAGHCPTLTCTRCLCRSSGLTSKYAAIASLNLSLADAAFPTKTRTKMSRLRTLATLATAGTA